MKFKLTNTGSWVIDKNEIDIFHFFDKTLCNFLCKYLKSTNIKTVYEFGCGNGLYSKKMIESGFDVDSSDGNPNTYNSTNGLSYTRDLTKNVELSPRDVVLCLEVGEHIPKKYEQIVLDNIFNSSKNIVILSWAIKGQSGTGHVNCQDNDYIIKQAEQRQFSFDEVSSKHFRRSSSLKWFKNTIMIFKKKQENK